jgi:hypothetical protein
MDQMEAQTVSEAYLKERPLIDLYDEVIIPALAMAERDRHRGLLEPAKETYIMQSISELVAQLAGFDPELPPQRSRFDSRIVCLPANDQADEITAVMLTQVLEQTGQPAICLTVADSGNPETLDNVFQRHGDTVCICALPPFALLSARTLSKRLRARFPDLKIVVGLWNISDGGTRIQEVLGKAFVDTLVTTLKNASEEITASPHSTAPRAAVSPRLSGLPPEPVHPL